MSTLKELEEKSQKEFEEYCQKTKVPVLFWIIIAMIIVYCTVGTFLCTKAI